MFEKLIIMARGSKRVISTSKIRKITAIKKNRKEKGRRADPFGSNPHSKGEFFSRSIMVFFARSEARIITTELITSVIRMENNKMIIAFSRFILDLLVGSQIYFYTKVVTSSSVNGNIKEKSYYVDEMSISGCSFKTEVMIR